MSKPFLMYILFKLLNKIIKFLLSLLRHQTLCLWTSLQELDSVTLLIIQVIFASMKSELAMTCMTFCRSVFFPICMCVSMKKETWIMHSWLITRDWNLEFVRIGFWALDSQTFLHCFRHFSRSILNLLKINST